MASLLDFEFCGCSCGRTGCWANQPITPPSDPAPTTAAQPRQASSTKPGPRQTPPAPRRRLGAGTPASLQAAQEESLDSADRGRRRWTEEETQALKDLSDLPDTEIAELLGRTLYAVTRRRSILYKQGWRP